MSSLLDLSGKIDQAKLALFETLNDMAGAAGIRFFVVGATARDMIFELGHGLSSGRATLDMDIGVRLGTWDEFRNLKESLLRSGQFTPAKEVQWLQYRGGLLIDFLPFGGIADAKCEIRWPPDQDVAMSVVGFEDAYEAAQPVRLRATPPLDILVASAAGLTIMKFIAWADRPHERSRDAQDVAYILDRYLDVGNVERFQKDHKDLVDVENFDYVLAGARLLGRDIARIGKPETIARIREILAIETADEGRYLLIRAMIANSVAADSETETIFEKQLAVLRELKRGTEER